MNDTLKALSKPFPAEFIEWRPGATNKDKTQAQALAYVDPRCYQDRLNEVYGLGWSSLRDIQFTPEKAVITVTLYIGSASRSGVGESSLTDKFGKGLAITKADAQAFKRACVEYGLGRYLYDWGRVWVAFDANTKRFTKTALSALKQKAHDMTLHATKQWEGKKVEKPSPKKEPEKKIKLDQEKGPSAVKIHLNKKAFEIGSAAPSEPQLKLYRLLLDKILGGDTAKRRTWQKWTFNKDSSKDMTKGQVQATLNMLKLEKDEETGYHEPTSEKAIEAIKAMFKQALIDAGQTEMTLEQSVEELYDPQEDLPF